MVSDTNTSKLQDLRNEIKPLYNLPRFCSEYKVWKKKALRLLKSIYGEDSDYVAQFDEISYSLSIATTGTPDSEWQEAYVNGLNEAELLLNSYLDEIYDEWENPTSEKLTTKQSTNDVFIVHGHDVAAREETARFVEKLKLHPIILKDQASGGRTTIEKFIEESKTASFAIVLFTPDDIGFQKDKSNSPLPRARQNVIFELGYFISTLGRKNVVVLRKKDVEILSDFQGVIYIDYDENGAWKSQLAKEMKNANMQFDMNDVI